MYVDIVISNAFNLNKFFFLCGPCLQCGPCVQCGPCIQCGPCVQCGQCVQLVQLPKVPTVRPSGAAITKDNVSAQ